MFVYTPYLHTLGPGSSILTKKKPSHAQGKWAIAQGWY